MFRIFQHHIPKWALIQLIADGLLCLSAVLLAYLHVSSSSVKEALLPHSSQVALAAAGFASFMLLLYLVAGSYRRMTLGAGMRIVLGRPFLAAFLGTGIVFLLLKMNSGPSYAAELLGITVLYMALGILLVRGLICLATRFALGASRVLIVGSGPEAQSVASDLRTTATNQVTVVGFYDADINLLSQPWLQPAFASTIPIQTVVAQQKVDEVIVAVGERRGGIPIEQLLACRIMGIPIMDMVGFYERTQGELPTHSLRASWLVYGNGFSQGRSRKVAKRIFDLITSSILITLAFPVMLLTAFAIKLEGPGPIIYRQQRVGLGGRDFTCLKFRSMRTDAEIDGVARWAQENDSRVTRVGRFIRATRIDELPQLFTVLCGQMSMVGPRPERPCFVAELTEKIPFYNIRHSVKPGLTGWAQVRYRYGSSIEDAERKQHFDLYYIKNGSLFLDLLILIETVSVVAFREGAQ
jgi:sugar transferase (PEP-CTERM system associated)